MKIMLAVWCFMVFGAVGERLAVSGKQGEVKERGGVRIESGSTLFVSLHPHFFFHERHFLLEFIVKGSRCQNISLATLSAASTYFQRTGFHLL